ncbi:MAG: DUF262 domain-containing protein [Selenomonadaceae bacterium]|nr:DUF262 domain-containing protein [Selenomonadaceae bacterium]
MKTTLRTDLTVGDICTGFEYDSAEGKGLYGWGGKLTIQPEYQRHYLYAEQGGGRERAVVDSIMRGYPIGLLYFNQLGDKFEVLDGQQRITSLGRFTKDLFAVDDAQGNPQYFGSMPTAEREQFLTTPLTIYTCEGIESEIKAWYRTINIKGLELNQQEIDNAIYSGPFVTAAKKIFSNSTSPKLNLWKNFVKGNVKRQDFLREALEWIVKSKDDKAVETYMSQHRWDATADDLEDYFEAVIAWACATFPNVREEMCGLEWGRLYETYHTKTYDVAKLAAEADELFAEDDDIIKDKRGIYEYLLSDKTLTKLLHVRYFSEAVKRTTYDKQTQEARAEGKSNCPLCASGKGPNAKKIWERKDMDADHVTAWSKGGSTTAANCQVLCKFHNRLKGNI